MLGLSGVCESINDECFSSCFSDDEAAWSEGKCPSCVAARDQNQHITVTHLGEKGREREEETKLLCAI